MTSTLTVADRRRAALERLHGTDRAEPARRRAGTPPTATRLRPSRPSVRAAHVRQAPRRAASTPRVRPVLGPPPGTFYAIAGVVTVLVMLGLVMVLSASAVTEANLGHSPYRVFGRQAMWAVLGMIGLIICVRIDYRSWRRVIIPLGLLAAAAMAAPFAPGIGANVNGAQSWIRLGPLSMQPSEFLKLAVVLLAADLLVRREQDLGDRRRTLLPIGVLAAVGAGLCLVQGDLGSAVVLGAIVFSVAWIAGVPVTPLAVMVAGAAGAGLLFVVSSPRRLDRFTAFMNVTEEKDHLAYQTYQGFLSMASGGITGSGIGGSNGKLGYLPYAHSDFIFAVIADELGLIGTIAVIGGFVMLVGLGVQTALAAPDRFGMLLAGGLAAWFGVQAIVNLGGVTGLMPVTGLTLPFFSAGGSSLFVSMLAAGLLLSVARRVNST
jgi:cell division protein FtsW